MNLLQKLFKIFGVFIPEGTSTKASIREIDRRGKIDLRKITEIVFLLAEEIEDLKTYRKK